MNTNSATPESKSDLDGGFLGLCIGGSMAGKIVANGSPKFRVVHLGQNSDVLPASEDEIRSSTHDDYETYEIVQGHEISNGRLDFWVLDTTPGVDQYRRDFVLGELAAFYASFEYEE